MAASPSIRPTIIVTARQPTSNLPACIAALQAQVAIPSAAELFVVGAVPQNAVDSVIGTTHVETNPAAARNFAIENATGAIICLIDADCTPTPDWLATICAPFENGEIDGCKGVYASAQHNVIARFIQQEYEDKYDRLRQRDRIDFIDTYSAAYRATTLRANNGFDRRFALLEDQELSFRLAARGYDMVFQPNATVDHDHFESFGGYFRHKFNIGFWKAQVVRRFPTQGVADSHTPQVVKLQMGALAILLLTLVAGFLWSTAWAVTAASALFFVATTVPLIGKIWKRDRAVAGIAIPLLAVRALALGCGYAKGLLQPQPGISGTESTIGGLNYLFKRVIDILGAVVGLLILAIIGLPLALAIKADSSGPVFFRQERIGRAGKPFTIFKFRSMSADAEAQLDSLVDLDTLDEPVFKLDDDPRVTRIGRIMRRWSVDELPQFWNVFIGNMSLVGPRPEESRIVARYSDWHRRRLAVKPGISGPMQVSGRGDLTLNERVQLELDYIENYSLTRDIQILIKTFPSVIGGEGAR